MNLALNASYVGDFQIGEQEARTQQPDVFSLQAWPLPNRDEACSTKRVTPIPSLRRSACRVSRRLHPVWAT